MRWTAGPAAPLLVLLLGLGGAARAGRPPGDHLAGQVVDYTHNHGADNRIWSDALHQRRDLYVYLPPGYDPDRHYPVLIWLHGINQDEKAFLESALLLFDAAMASGRLPPMIIADPDGSLNGRGTPIGADPLFLNSRLGNFEDFITHDVWPFLLARYPIRP